ncbi:MAG TPA: ABC transporter permease [Solirubrobacterales bacterium]|jgi:NitT/TauT family transport system permease protein/putative hydroxymethylpyrimidine transport system permease protein
MKKWLLPALLLAGLIGAWQVAASTGAIADALNLEHFLVPSPAEIASSLWENRSLLAENAWVTLREVIFGFACGLAAGLAFAVALHLSETLRRAAYPLVIASQTIPIVVIAPILVVWFGFGIGPKLAIVALICFFPITVNTLDGLRSVDPEATKMMRTLDASRSQILWRLEAPTALPYTFSGAKIAVAVAVIGAVFGEWAGSDSGLGHLMLQDNAQLETARLFASVFVLSAIAVGLFGLLALAERRIVTWR